MTRQEGLHQSQNTSSEIDAPQHSLGGFAAHAMQVESISPPYSSADERVPGLVPQVENKDEFLRQNNLQHPLTGLVPKPTLIRQWLNGESPTPGNVTVYRNFLETNLSAFPQAIEVLAQYPADPVAPDTATRDDQIACAIASIFRNRSLWPLLQLGSEVVANDTGQQALTPTVVSSLSCIGNRAGAQVWNIAAVHHRQHGSLPSRRDIELDLERRNQYELILSPNFTPYCKQVLDLCYCPDVGNVDSISTRCVTDFLEKLLYIRPLAAVADWWKQTGHWSTDAADRAIHMRQELHQIVTASEWPVPEPLAGPNLPEFPVDILPPTLRDWVTNEAIATQTPVDLPAMLALGVCAGALAKYVEVKVRDGWCEPVNIYAVTVLESGNRKSAVFEDAIASTRAVEAEEVHRAASAVAAHETGRQILVDRQKRLQQQAGKAQDDDERRQLTGQAIAVGEELRVMRPVSSPRLLADDCTPEKLEVLMAAQDGRILVAAPEGGVFELMGGRYADKTSLGVYLHGHTGEDLRTDRISRDSVYISRPALTMALTVQPQVIRKLGTKEEFRGQGLLARFLYSIPKSLVGARLVAPPPMPSAVIDRFNQLTCALWAISCDPLAGPQQSIQLEFSSEARQRLTEFMEEIEPRLGVCGDLYCIRDWASKLAGAIVRLVGTLHVVSQIERMPAQPQHGCYRHMLRSNAAEKIGPEIVDSTIQIGRYLIEHAKVAFGMMGSSDTPAVARVADAQSAVRWIIEGNRTEFSKRDLYKSDKTRYPRAECVDAVIGLLIDRNIIRRTDDAPTSRGGRPSERYEVNPQLFQGYDGLHAAR